MHETVITGGLVADGTGTALRRADVAIDDDRISAVGSGLTAARRIDASGCVVSPGFIDIHTHYDAQVFWDAALTPSCLHGVTTVIAGNCGFSIAPTRPGHRQLIAQTLQNVEDMDVPTLEAGIPWDFETFPEYLDSVQRRGLVINFAAYIGHTALRLYVMGDDGYSRSSTSAERTEMQLVLAEALDAGAAGFATSFLPTHQGALGRPVPSRLADRDEILALLAVISERRRGIVSIAPGGWCDLQEVYTLQRSTQVPFTYGALLTKPDLSHRARVDLNEREWATGAEVWPQVTPRPLTFSFSMASPFLLNPNPSFAALMGTELEARKDAYRDPRWRASADAAYEDRVVAEPRWATWTVAESVDQSNRGRSILEIAAERGTSLVETVCDLSLAEPGLELRISCVVANDDPAEVGYLLQQEHCTLGLSDAGAHVGQLCDAPQATDFLARWVRERQVMPIHTAVRRLTGLQADIFGFVDRGYIVPGYQADLTIFDPATVEPGDITMVRDFPAGAHRLTAASPIGIRHVMVNGQLIIEDQRVQFPDRAHGPGMVVRPGKRDRLAFRGRQFLSAERSKEALR